MRRKARTKQKTPGELLTPLILKKAKRLDWKTKQIFEIWRKSERVEYLPENIPYKLSNEELVRKRGSTYVLDLNQPLILVSDLLSKAGRQDVARHELVEWKNYDPKFPMGGHLKAVKQQNRELRKEMSIIETWFIMQSTIFSKEYAKNLTRADYLKWRDTREAIERYGPTGKKI